MERISKAATENHGRIHTQNPPSDTCGSRIFVETTSGGEILLHISLPRLSFTKDSSNTSSSQLSLSSHRRTARSSSGEHCPISYCCNSSFVIFIFINTNIRYSRLILYTFLYLLLSLQSQP